ncbi:MAG: hypothetical protein PUB18_00880 [bacterium]|nr:hypothetical protein [bacterium]
MEDIYFIGANVGRAGNSVVAAATELVIARDILEETKRKGSFSFCFHIIKW